MQNLHLPQSGLRQSGHLLQGRTITISATKYLSNYKLRHSLKCFRRFKHVVYLGTSWNTQKWRSKVNSNTFQLHQSISKLFLKALARSLKSATTIFWPPLNHCPSNQRLQPSFCGSDVWVKSESNLIYRSKTLELTTMEIMYLVGHWFCFKMF